VFEPVAFTCGPGSDKRTNRTEIQESRCACGKLMSLYTRRVRCGAQSAGDCRANKRAAQRIIGGTYVLEANLLNVIASELLNPLLISRDHSTRDAIGANL
jgi:hypothetical protein